MSTKAVAASLGLVRKRATGQTAKDRPAASTETTGVGIVGRLDDPCTVSIMQAVAKHFPEQLSAVHNIVHRQSIKPAVWRLYAVIR